MDMAVADPKASSPGHTPCLHHKQGQGLFVALSTGPPSGLGPPPPKNVFSAVLPCPASPALTKLTYLLSEPLCSSVQGTGWAQLLNQMHPQMGTGGKGCQRSWAQPRGREGWFASRVRDRASDKGQIRFLLRLSKAHLRLLH